MGGGGRPSSGWGGAKRDGIAMIFVHNQKSNGGGGQWGAHVVNGGTCPPGPP